MTILRSNNKKLDNSRTKYIVKPLDFNKILDKEEILETLVQDLDFNDRLCELDLNNISNFKIIST